MEYLHGGKITTQAKLFVFDVEAGKIVRDIIPVTDPKLDMAGPVLETTPGVLIGTTTNNAGRGVIYGVDVNTGKLMHMSM